MRNFPTSSFKRPLSADNDCADVNTRAAAEPASCVRDLTSVVSEATSVVCSAAWLTLRAISFVAASCSSTAAAMVLVIWEMWLMVLPIS